MKTIHAIIQSIYSMKHRANPLLKKYANTNYEQIYIYITP